MSPIVFTNTAMAYQPMPQNSTFPARNTQGGQGPKPRTMLAKKAANEVWIEMMQLPATHSLSL